MKKSFKYTIIFLIGFRGVSAQELEKCFELEVEETWICYYSSCYGEEHDPDIHKSTYSKIEDCQATMNYWSNWSNNDGKRYDIRIRFIKGCETCEGANRIIPYEAENKPYEAELGSNDQTYDQVMRNKEHFDDEVYAEITPVQNKNF